MWRRTDNQIHVVNLWFLRFSLHIARQSAIFISPWEVVLLSGIAGHRLVRLSREGSDRWVDSVLLGCSSLPS